MTVTIIELDQIIVSEERQRKYFPEAEMSELQESIATKGLFSPIMVRPTAKPTKFLLVAGERRLRSIQNLTEPYTFGEQTVEPGFVPALIKYFDTDMDAHEVELHENIVRLDLTWQEKAEAIARLHKLKVEQNPKHTKGMTADLIEDKQHGNEWALVTTRRKVNDALLVADFLDDPEVVKARDMAEAGKIVSRRLEEEALQRLRDLKEQQVDVQATDESTGDDKVADELLDLLAPKRKPKEKLGILLEGDVRMQLPKVADGSVHVVLTDPPYGQGADKFNDGGRATQKHEYEDTREYAMEMYQVLINELDRVCAGDAHAYLFCDIDMFPHVKELFSDEWWVRRKPLIWDKGSSGKLAEGMPTGWRTSAEFIVHARRGKRPCAKVKSDVLAIPDERNKYHAAQKPLALYKELLSMSALPGDTILDAFAGTGVIFKAARELMLNPIGIEMSEKFIEVCKLAQYDDTDVI